MPGLSAWAVRRPVLALIAWFVTVAAIGVLGIGFGGNYNDSFDPVSYPHLTLPTT